MLNIGKLAVGGGEYYLEVVACGVEDYYLGAGEAPGWWTGSATRLPGLSGQVGATDLQAVLAGTHPRTGEQLRSGRDGPRLPGFDQTFRHPRACRCCGRSPSPTSPRRFGPAMTGPSRPR